LSTITPKRVAAQAQPRDIKALHRWIAVIRSFPGLSPITIKTAGAIAMHFNLKAERCTIRYETIAGQIGADRRSVIRAVSALEAAGLISAERRGGRNPNRYRLSTPANAGGRS
jgi:hypothetical protein